MRKLFRILPPTRVSTFVHGAVPYVRHGKEHQEDEKKQYAEEVFAEDSSAVIDSCDTPEDREKPVEEIVAQNVSEETPVEELKKDDSQILGAAPETKKKKSSKKKSE